jgi:hypothetical protein
MQRVLNKLTDIEKKWVSLRIWPANSWFEMGAFCGLNKQVIFNGEGAIPLWYLTKWDVWN